MIDLIKINVKDNSTKIVNLCCGPVIVLEWRQKVQVARCRATVRSATLVRFYKFVVVVVFACWTYLLVYTGTDWAEIRSRSVARWYCSSRSCRRVSGRNRLRNQEPPSPTSPITRGIRAGFHPHWSAETPYNLLWYFCQLCQLGLPGYCRYWTCQWASQARTRAEWNRRA